MSCLQLEKGALTRGCQVTLMSMLGIEYIICSMASQCVSAISALHPSASPRAAISGFRSDIADIHLEAMLYILHIMYKCNYHYYHSMNTLQCEL